MNTLSRSFDTHIELSTSAKAEAVVIWLHGLGADGHDFVPIVPALQLPAEHPVRFIFPHAPIIPVTINAGYNMRAWFDIKNNDRIDSGIDRIGIQASVNTVHRFIENELSRGLRHQHIFLAGFSQGAVIALTAALQHSLVLGGVIALSGYLPDAAALTSESQHTFPIFLAHGTDDTIVPFSLGEMTEHALQQAGFEVSLHRYKMGHSVCEQEILDIGQWLKHQLGLFRNK